MEAIVDRQGVVERLVVSMETQGIALQNSWHALSAAEGGGARGGGKGGARGGRGVGRGLPTGGDAIAAFRNARGAPLPPRGGGSGGVQQNGVPAPTANTNGTDAAQSWNTYQNRSNLQRARKEGGVRTLTVEEAIKEIEDKSTAVHTNNIGGRASLWGQWCRRMEDSRIDSDCKYIDPAQDGAVVPFEEVFLRSKALEDAVASVLRYPLTDDTELSFLLSHCLEGDALLHQKIADGLKAMGECFRDNNRTVPDDFVEHMNAVIRALKVDSAIRRDSGQALYRIDEQMSFQMAKWQELTREGAASAPDARHRCSAELVRLGVEKHKLLTGASTAANRASASSSSTLADQEHVRVLFEELLSVINNVLEACSTEHGAAERQFEAFQTRIRAAMMGDDAEYTRVLEEDRRLDAEISKLTAKKLELQRQLDDVSVELQTYEHKKRAHTQQSAKVLSTYNQRMKSFTGENQKVEILKSPFLF